MTAGPSSDHRSPGARVAPGHADRVALAITVAYLPLLFLGYGTDIDVGNVRRSGELLLEGDYGVSRTPGSFPTEALTGLTDAVGGAWLVNAVSLVAALAAMVLLGRIVAREADDRAAVVAVLVLGLNPWFVVAATSLGDMVPALALTLLGLWLAPRHPVVAGLAYGLAIGTRMGSALFVGGFLLADLIAAERGARGPALRASIRIGLAAAVVGAASFVPAWLQYDQTTAFLDNQFEAGSGVTLVGRWVVKNVAFFGLPVLALLALRSRHLLGSIRAWRSSELVRVAIVLAVLTEAVFLRLPFKIVHLLPMAVAIAVLVACTPKLGNRFVAALLAAQVALALVSVTIASPDTPDAATTGEFRPGLVWGVVVNDVRCRIDPPVDPPAPDPLGDEAMAAAEEMFRCQARSWRAE